MNAPQNTFLCFFLPKRNGEKGSHQEWKVSCFGWIANPYGNGSEWMAWWTTPCHYWRYKHVNETHYHWQSIVRERPAKPALLLPSFSSLSPPPPPFFHSWRWQKAAPTLRKGGRKGGRLVDGTGKRKGGQEKKRKKGSTLSCLPPSATTLPVFYRGSCEHNLGIIEMDKLFRLAEMWHCLGLKAKLPPSYFPSTLSVNLR